VRPLRAGVQSRHLLRGFVVIGAAVGLAGACVRQGPPPVGVRALQANLVFSTTPAPPAPPTVAPPVPSGPPGDQFITVDLGPINDQPIYKLRPALGTPAACPAAGPNAYPAEEATLNAKGLPAMGSYRWKRTGTYALAIAPDQALPLGGFESRLIRNVASQASDGSIYTFETVQPSLQGSPVVSEWQVKTAALSTTPQELTVTAPNIGDPERGLALKSQTVTGSDGKIQHQYVFNPGVLFAPLPIQAGETFQGVGVDPSSGETLSINGSVDRHQRVDACGEIVDGWQINTTETFSGSNNQPATYNYLVATQLGTIIIGEHIDASTADGHFVVDYTIGQTKPDPLPVKAN
jgi:hypothetical protein